MLQHTGVEAGNFLRILGEFYHLSVVLELDIVREGIVWWCKDRTFVFEGVPLDAIVALFLLPPFPNFLRLFLFLLATFLWTDRLLLHFGLDLGLCHLGLRLDRLRWLLLLLGSTVVFLFFVVEVLRFGFVGALLFLLVLLILFLQW